MEFFELLYLILHAASRPAREVYRKFRSASTVRCATASIRAAGSGMQCCRRRALAHPLAVPLPLQCAWETARLRYDAGSWRRLGATPFLLGPG